MSRNAVLLVEDNSDDELLTIIALREAHPAIELVVAHDGVEALDFLFGTGAYAARDTKDVPQVVLLDMKLPRIDGLEVLRRMRADVRTHNIPVVMLSGSNQDQDVEAAYDLGANSYVRKPIDFSQFTDVARQLGLYWLALNQVPPRP